MQRAGQTPAHNSQPMHFSMPSSYRLRTWRPWNRSGFGRFSSGYWTVTFGSNICLKVTRKPSRYPMSGLLSDVSDAGGALEGGLGLGVLAADRDGPGQQPAGHQRPGEHGHAIRAVDDHRG